MNHARIRVGALFGRRRLPLIVLGAGLGAFAGCQTGPFAEDQSRAELEASIEREIASMATDDPYRRVSRQVSSVEAELADRREDLDALGPATGDLVGETMIGPDLMGAENQGGMLLSLEDAVAKAVENSLPIEIARLGEAISEEDIITAESEFDFVFFSSADLTRTDQPSTTPVIAGQPVGVPFRQSDTRRFETGVSKRFQTGAALTVSTDVTRTDDKTPNVPGADFEVFPDPAYESAVRIGVDQPLLRGFGTAVNRANIRLAESANRQSIELLRNELLDTIAATEVAYWELVLAWRTLEISEWLVEVGLAVRDKLRDRRILDTTQAQYADAVARVEQRRADVIRARRAVWAASDTLKLLLNDDELTIGAETVIRPKDGLIDERIKFNLRDIILTALRRRPEISLATLAIDDAEIRQEVAENAELPLLDLTAQAWYLGLDDGLGDSYDNLLDADFIDYVVGITFEVPVGNRGPEAQARRARLERSRAVLDYRLAVQRVVLDVKSALRDVVTDYELIQATRSFRIAQAENLRALEVEEVTMRDLTPEFLNLKFQRQDTLADARNQEIRALGNYDQSVARLFEAMGIGLDLHGIGLETYDPSEIPPPTTLDRWPGPEPGREPGVRRVDDP